MLKVAISRKDLGVWPEKFSSPILATKFLPWSGNFFLNLNFGALF